MKTLILYTSHHGTTQKLAYQLAKDLEINSEFVIDFKKNKNIDLSNYDLIIIGSSIHVGKIPSDFKNFLMKNLSLLLTKKVAIFMCAMEKTELKIQEFENNFPKELRDHSLANGIMGGEYLFEKMNFFEKFIVKKITGSTESKSEIDYDIYEDFVEKLKLSA